MGRTISAQSSRYRTARESFEPPPDDPPPPVLALTGLEVGRLWHLTGLLFSLGLGLVALSEGDLRRRRRNDES